MLDSMPYKPSPTDLDLEENPEYLETLRKERKRTSKGVTAIAEASGYSNLSVNRIKNILGGQVRYIDRAEYDALLRTYELFPTVKRMKLTVHKINRLKALMKEKSIGKAQITKSLPKYFNFNVSNLNDWLTRATKTADQKIFDAIMNYVEQFEPIKKVKISDDPAPPRLVEISDEYLEKLEAEIKRTNFDPNYILKRFQIHHIQSVMLHNWRKRRTKKARPDNLKLILETYAKLPDAGKW